MITIFFIDSILFKNKIFNLRVKDFFKLDEIRRILEIISTNRVKDEKEILFLSQLLERANISSNNKRYQRLIDSVCNMQIFKSLFYTASIIYVDCRYRQIAMKW